MGVLGNTQKIWYVPGELLFAPVLVLLGSCNQIPEIGWLTNNKPLFLTVLEADKSKTMALIDRFSVRLGPSSSSVALLSL